MDSEAYRLRIHQRWDRKVGDRRRPAPCEGIARQPGRLPGWEGGQAVGVDLDLHGRRAPLIPQGPQDGPRCRRPRPAAAARAWPRGAPKPAGVASTSPTWTASTEAPGTAQVEGAGVRPADVVPDIDHDPAVGPSGQAGDLVGGGDIGDAGPGEVLDVDEQPGPGGLRRTGAKAGAAAAGPPAHP